MITREISFICSICGESVEAIFSKTDEHGKPVHSMCYAAKVERESKLSRKGSVASRHAASEQSQPPKVA
jgi:hypothetical protein